MADNQVLRDRFLHETYSHSKSSTNERRLFWARLAVIEETIGKQLEDGYTREEYLKLLSELNISQIGTLYANRGYIQKYFKWLQGIGFEGELNSDLLRKIKFEDLEHGEVVKGSYFKDFDSLQFEIDYTIKLADKIDDAVHDVAVSLIYLAWYGVTIDEVCMIRKQDIKPMNNMIYLPSTRRIVKVSEKVMDFLVNYRDAINYGTQARYGAAKMPYKESYFLLRTAKASSINVQNVKNILSRFTKYGDDTKFFYSRIRQSGIFSRVYDDESTNGKLVKNDYDRLAKVFGEDFKTYRNASDRLREYKRWKKIFYHA